MQKFSKRHSALSVRAFAEEGYFAETLVNFVALFGWSHKLGDDHLNLSDLIKHVGPRHEPSLSWNYQIDVR